MNPPAIEDKAPHEDFTTVVERHLVESQSAPRIGDYLVAKEVLTEGQLSLALREQKQTDERIGEILNRFGFVSKEHILEALAEIAPAALQGEDVILTAIPKDFLLETQTIISVNTDTNIFFITKHPDPDYIVQRLKEYVDEDCQISPITSIELCCLDKELRRLRNSKSEIKLTNLDDPNLMLQEIERYAIERNASDIHIETSQQTVHVRLRIDGIIDTYEVLNRRYQKQIFACLKTLAGMDIAEDRMPQDGSYTRHYRGRVVDFRVATLPEAFGEKATIRILDKEKTLIPLEKLGFSRLQTWKRLCGHPHGLVLVCGATGSGKSTSLYSTIKGMDTMHRSIYTIENPIEYVIPGINQCQVNDKKGFTFPYFCRTILRHDPDIIVVGEIRDPETAEAAIRMAETGHLVFGTLHTNDVPSSIDRLLGLGVDEIYVKSLLRGIMVQRLVRKICRICKGKGCEVCRQTGYRGRSVVMEIAEIKQPSDIDAILASKDSPAKPYYSFTDDIRVKLMQKVTSVEEMARTFNLDQALLEKGKLHISDPEEVIQQLSAEDFADYDKEKVDIYGDADFCLDLERHIEALIVDKKKELSMLQTLRPTDSDLIPVQTTTSLPKVDSQKPQPQTVIATQTCQATKAEAIPAAKHQEQTQQPSQDQPLQQQQPSARTKRVLAMMRALNIKYDK